MIWGGLHPIRSRFLLDICTILSFSYCSFLVSSFCRHHLDDDETTTTTNTINNSNVSRILSWLGVAFLGMTLSLKGQLTHRWPLTFPMMIVTLIHILHLGFFFVCDNSTKTWWWVSLGMNITSGLFLFASLLLIVAFPAVNISHPITTNGKEKYDVGVVDFFLPVQKEGSDEEECFVSARLLYPTTKGRNKTTMIPHLNPSMSNILCDATMKYTMKLPGWVLHTWCLAQLPLLRNAEPIDLERDDNDDKNNNSDESKQQSLPLVIYSHGLFGNYVTYTYQPLCLAAAGYVVLMLDHGDGSAPVVQKRDGSFLFHDEHCAKLSRDGKHLEHIRARRSQTKQRISELLSATQSLLNLNETNIPQLQSLGVSFVNKLDVENGVTFMGHSFGGATALSAAAQRPDLVRAVVAHEPACDWMTDDGRKALFPDKKFVDSEISYSGGTGGYEEDDTKSDDDAEEKKEQYERRMSSSSLLNRSKLHDVDMLFLYSDQWAAKGWGSTKQIEDLHKRGELGPKEEGVSASDYGVIADATHIEFSDCSMLTPTWIGRASGNCGKRSPHDTAQEIASRTILFLENVKEVQGKRKQE